MPHVIKFCREEDDELREYCLQAFESFVRRCPKEISSFVPEVGFHTCILPVLMKEKLNCIVYLFWTH